MIGTKRVGLLVGGAVLTLTGGSSAETPVEVQNLRARVAQLEARVANVAELEARLAALESQDHQNWLTEQRANEIKGLVQDVLADAQARSSLLAQGPVTAGYDNGAVLGSADGNWLLRTNLLLQERFMLRSQDGTPPFGVAFGDDDTVWGFENTRAKFILSGHVVNPQWFYRVSIETSTNTDASVAADVDADGDVEAYKADNRNGLDDSYIGYDFGKGFKVRVGTMKAPLLFEELVEAQYQQAVERSVVNYLYTGGYTDGIALEYATERFRAVGMYSNGIDDGLYGGGVGSLNPNFDAGTRGQPALVADTKLAITARGEWLAKGTWDQFQDYTSMKGEETGVLVGGAFHWQASEDDAGIPDVDLFVLTLDASVEFGGGNIYGAVIYSNADLPAGFSDVEPWAFILGGGWYFHEKWEVFGRYEWSDADVSTIENVSIITAGVNGYFAGQNAKWTTDIGFSLDTLAFEVPVTGWAIDAPGQDGQFIFRSQLQILF